MSQPETAQTRKSLPVRVPGDLLDRIDSLRGLIPRETYVRHLLAQAIEDQEQKAAKS